MSSGRGRRFLIDGTMARTGGGFTYLANLAGRLARLAPEDRFHLLLTSRRLADSIAPAENLRLELQPARGLAGRLRFTHLEAAGRARRLGAALYFTAGDFAPLRAPCPVVASFRNPNVFTDLDQHWYRYQVFRLGALRRMAGLTARACARVLFVSHDSARWIGDRIGLPEEKRVVIHHGIDAERWSRPTGSRPHPRPYLLSVSTIYRYKNFVRLIEAFTELARRRDDVDLLIVGDDMDPWYAGQMREARARAGPLAPRILLVGEVPYPEVQRYYAHALAFAFPSYLETFGHPLLEAMAARTPVLAAELPVFREVAGDAALYADPHDTGALGTGLERLVADATLRSELVRRGEERITHFSWDDSARKHLALFDALTGEASPARR